MRSCCSPGGVCQVVRELITLVFMLLIQSPTAKSSLMLDFDHLFVLVPEAFAAAYFSAGDKPEDEYDRKHCTDNAEYVLVRCHFYLFTTHPVDSTGTPPHLRRRQRHRVRLQRDLTRCAQHSAFDH